MAWEPYLVPTLKRDRICICSEPTLHAAQIPLKNVMCNSFLPDASTNDVRYKDRYLLGNLCMQRLEGTNLKCGFLSKTIVMALAIEISSFICSLNLPVCIHNKCYWKNHNPGNVAENQQAVRTERSCYLFQNSLKYFPYLFYKLLWNLRAVSVIKCITETKYNMLAAALLG